MGPLTSRSGATRTRTTSRSRSRAGAATASTPPRRTAASRACSSPDGRSARSRRRSAAAATLTWKPRQQDRHCVEHVQPVHGHDRAAKGDGAGQRSRRLQPADQRSRRSSTGPNGTTTGPLTIGVGEGTVRETAARRHQPRRLQLDDRLHPQRPARRVGPGTSVDGAIGNGDVVVCTFTNTRTAPLPCRCRRLPSAIPVRRLRAAPPVPIPPAATRASTSSVRKTATPRRPSSGQPDHVPHHGHERLDRGGSGCQCRPRVRALLPAEGALTHAVAGKLRAGRLQPRPARTRRLGHDHGGHAGGRRRRRWRTSCACQLRGAGNGRPEQRRLGARADHEAPRRGRGQGSRRDPRVRHAHGLTARPASGRDLARARPGPEPLASPCRECR